MNIQMYQIDSFTDTRFRGNPAGVCPLGDSWLDESLMQNIAMENNLAETAFYIFKDNQYHIRWFTPEVEVDLCGHATLASAYVLLMIEHIKGDSVSFESRSGTLTVRKDGDFLVMNFPTDVIREVEADASVCGGFGIKPLKVFKGKTDYMLVFEHEDQIRTMPYDISKISTVEARGIIITAKGNDVDFVSRFFAPQSGIDEDPVTGSAYTTLTPYWSKVLQKNELTAVQLSKRTGFIKCKNLGDRIEISGKAVLYLKGEIYI
jgi:PhzF family phenazine biosynthesis protein